MKIDMSGFSKDQFAVIVKACRLLAITHNRKSPTFWAEFEFSGIKACLDLKIETDSTITAYVDKTMLSGKWERLIARAARKSGKTFDDYVTDATVLVAKEIIDDRSNAYKYGYGGRIEFADRARSLGLEKGGIIPLLTENAKHLTREQMAFLYQW